MAPSPGPDTELDCHTSHLNLHPWSLDTEADIVSFPQTTGSNTAICYDQGKVNDLCLRLGYCVCYIYRDSDGHTWPGCHEKPVPGAQTWSPLTHFPAPVIFLKMAQVASGGAVWGSSHLARRRQETKKYIF